MIPRDGTHDDAKNVWHARAGELAEWAMARLVNRDDRYGGYTPEGVITKPSASTPGCVSVGLLRRHFAATKREHVVGLHALGPGNVGRWVGIDIDRHDEDGDADANETFALSVYDRLAALGFRPLLTPSNGKGGFHVRAFFAEPVPSELLHSFGNWLVRDAANFGIPKVEAFPKQPKLAAPGERGEWGNWLRVPGRHHSRDYWSVAWDGTKWMTPDETVEYILSIAGDDVGNIPSDAYPTAPEPKQTRTTPTTRAEGEEETPWDYFNRTADFAAMLMAEGAEPTGKGKEWRRPGKESGTSGTLGVERDPASGAPLLFTFSDAWLNLRDWSWYTPFDYEVWRRHGRLDKSANVATVEALRNEGKIPPAPRITMLVNGKPLGSATVATEPTVKPESNTRDFRDGLFGKPPENMPTEQPVPPFPLEVFPAVVAEFWKSAADALYVPVDYVAVLGVGLLGAAIGRAYSAQVKKGWAESPQFWVALVAPPGATKSAALSIAEGPLSRIASRWVAEHSVALCEFEGEKVRYDEDVKNWKDGGCVGPFPAKPAEPAIKQLAYRNYTAENLIRGNIAYPKGVAIVKDELSGLVASLNQYRSGGKGDDKQNYLSMWAGSSVTINRESDRKAGKPPAHLERSFLAVVGTIQPDLLSSFRGDLQRPGAAEANDGWSDRWLMIYADPYPMVPETWATVDDDVKARYDALFEALVSMEMLPEFDPNTGEVFGQVPHVGLFDDDANAAWVEFTGRIADRGNALERNDPYRGVLSKYKTQCVRLIALLQGIRIGTGEADLADLIPGHVVQSAEKLVDYFDGHGRRCLGVGFADTTSRIANRLLKWLSRNPEITSFSKSDAYLQLKDGRHVRTGDDLAPTFQRLADHNFIRPITRTEYTRSGPVAEVYAVNPFWQRTQMAPFDQFSEQPVPKVPNVRPPSNKRPSNIRDNRDGLCPEVAKTGHPEQPATLPSPCRIPTPARSAPRPTPVPAGRKTWRDDLLAALDTAEWQTAAQLGDRLSETRNGRPSSGAIRSALNQWLKYPVRVDVDQSSTPYRYRRLSTETSAENAAEDAADTGEPTEQEWAPVFVIFVQSNPGTTVSAFCETGGYDPKTAERVARWYESRRVVRQENGRYSMTEDQPCPA